MKTITEILLESKGKKPIDTIKGVDIFSVPFKESGAKESKYSKEFEKFNYKLWNNVNSEIEETLAKYNLCFVEDIESGNYNKSMKSFNFSRLKTRNEKSDFDLDDDEERKAKSNLPSSILESFDIGLFDSINKINGDEIVTKVIRDKRFHISFMRKGTNDPTIKVEYVAIY